MHALTSTGGKVITASASGNIAGKKIALEGDRVFCPACKTEGKIFCVGPRNREHWNGKKIALENDFCLCKCPVLPKLVSVQNVRYQQISETGTPTHATASDSASNDGHQYESIIEQYFSLAGANGEPINDFHYDLLEDGVVRTKASPFINGKTIQIEGNRELDLIAWLSPGAENEHGKT
nr:PAAR domain-containing protein [Pseudoduganella danionis]